MKKPILIVSILAIVIITLFGIRSVVANELSTSGVALGEIQDEIIHYQTENIMIREEINNLSSLANISSAAAKLGFSQSKSNFALKKTQPIALSQ